MKKLPKLGSIVIVKKDTTYHEELAKHFYVAVPNKSTRAFRVISRSVTDNNVTLESVCDSSLVFAAVQPYEIKKL